MMYAPTKKAPKGACLSSTVPEPYYYCRGKPVAKQVPYWPSPASSLCHIWHGLEWNSITVETAVVYHLALVLSATQTSGYEPDELPDCSTPQQSEYVNPVDCKNTTLPRKNLQSSVAFL